MVFFAFIAGLALLIAGAQLLIRGSVSIAMQLGIPPLIIGLTLVAFGTSSPELAVSIQAAISGQAGVALGNVVGSNLFNILFILGLCALILPLSVSSQIIKQDIPLLFGFTLIVFMFSLDALISLMNAIILLLVLLAYILLLIWQSTREVVSNDTYDDAGNNGQINLDYDKRKHSQAVPWWKSSLQILIGLGALVYGSHLLVFSASAFAGMLGVSELVIGLTVVAIGTSLPEIVTSVIAVLQKQKDIAVGNIIGSNIFNLLAVLGVSGVVSNSGILVENALLNFEFPLLLIVAALCLPIVFTSYEVSRKEGAFLLVSYVCYSIYLFLRAVEHEYLGVFYAGFMYLLLPLACIILLVSAFRDWKTLGS